jgi:hypothetical protein
VEAREAPDWEPAAEFYGNTVLTSLLRITG